MKNFTRRWGLQALGAGLVVAMSTRASGADAVEMPELSEEDAAAKAVGYVKDAHNAPASKGNSCAGCSLFGDSHTTPESVRGPCTVFPGRVVLAAGWCNKWSGL